MLGSTEAKYFIPSDEEKSTEFTCYIPSNEGQLSEQVYHIPSPKNPKELITETICHTFPDKSEKIEVARRKWGIGSYVTSYGFDSSIGVVITLKNSQSAIYNAFSPDDIPQDMIDKLKNNIMQIFIYEKTEETRPSYKEEISTLLMKLYKAFNIKPIVIRSFDYFGIVANCKTNDVTLINSQEDSTPVLIRSVSHSKITHSHKAIKTLESLEDRNRQAIQPQILNQPQLSLQKSPIAQFSVFNRTEAAVAPISVEASVQAAPAREEAKVEPAASAPPKTQGCACTIL